MAALRALSISSPAAPAEDAMARRSMRRVRPGDPEWPSVGVWDELKHQVGGRLIKVEPPLAACLKDPDSAACDEARRALKNPYFIGDDVALTQTSGWLDAWTSAPSVYAVRAATSADVAAAVNFARTHRLRLVVKGGGHSYQGTSNSADSLMIWTRDLASIVMHDSFVAQGCEGKQRPQPAVTLGAGVMWMQAYDAVTTQAGRYVQGGGCTTVGVAGLIQSGGFGSFSKNYGLAAAGLLEAEVVTADGKVRIANACQHPDLFWGIKGGGGGSLGVVTRLTLRTRELPEYFGGVFTTIQARSDSAFRDLVARVIAFYRDRLFNRHWGEQIRFDSRNTVSVSMVFQGLDRHRAKDIWQPFFKSIEQAPGDFAFQREPVIIDIPARHFWDAEYLKKHFPDAIVTDDRPGASPRNFFWKGDGDQVGHFLHGYRSAWLPALLLREKHQGRLADALFAASRHWSVSLHFNKGLAGAPREELGAAKNTATNPIVLDAFALAIIAGAGPAAFAGMRNHEPDSAAARRAASAIHTSMDELLKVVRHRGSYVSESDFFERTWQESFWGSNHPRLAGVKKKYDPGGLFFTHHGVGSEPWSADGFARLPGL